MHLISQVVDNIQKYGNSKIILSECEAPNSYWAINFRVNKKGKLKISGDIEFYDKSIFNDNKIKQIGKIHAVDYLQDDIKIPIVDILYTSLNEQSTYIFCDKSNKKDNTNHATRLLVEIISSMLNLSYNELTEMVTSSVIDNKSLLINKDIECYLDKNFNSNLAGEYIDLLMNKIMYHLKTVDYVWKNLKEYDSINKKNKDLWTMYRKDKKKIK